MGRPSKYNSKDDPNRTYEDTIIKTTVNLELDLIKKAHARMKDMRIKFFSEYIRAVLWKDIWSAESRVKKPISLTQYLEDYDDPEISKRFMEDVKKVQGIVDKPKKFSGFIAGLQRNSFKLNWFKKNSEKYLDQYKPQ